MAHLCKLLFSLFLFTFLSFPLASRADGDPVFSCPGEACGAEGGLKVLLGFLPGTGIIESDNLILVILGWVRFGLALLGTIAFVALVWAGFLYVTAFAGGEESTETAKKIIIWTAIGIILILISYAVVSVLITATA
ncbi:hypothetical protein IPN35_05465 [Candidatus Peregrinibacteria bacterium]|nr:MAG: hypothetical protein IPN35_05465 [Candidatus Peregrinibacteria bacterium]